MLRFPRSISAQNTVANCTVASDAHEFRQLRQDLGRAVALCRVSAHAEPERRHPRCRLQASAGYVANGDDDPIRADLDDVVPIAADVDALDSRDVPGTDLDSRQSWEILGEQAVLQRQRDGALGGIELGVLRRELLCLAPPMGESLDEHCRGDRQRQSEQDQDPPQAGEQQSAQFFPRRHDDQEIGVAERHRR